MMPPIVDTHAHLDVEQFDNDRDHVIDRALEAGVTTIISAATDIESSLKVVRLAEEMAVIRAAVGIHPGQAPGVTEEDISRLAEIAEGPGVVAIGEIGLDYYHDSSFREAQLQVLQWQMELSLKLELPVILHCRQAEQDLLPLLCRWLADNRFPGGKARGVIHCFSGDIATARSYLDLGFFVSLGAYIGYPSSRRLADLIHALPLDKLLLETDCPYLPPQNRRGQRNEPSYLPLTAGTLAEIRGVAVETIARVTTGNACRLFGLTM